MNDDNGEILQELRETRASLFVLIGVALQLRKQFIPADIRQEENLADALVDARRWPETAKKVLGL